jgi:hypothetical protein
LKSCSGSQSGYKLIKDEVAKVSAADGLDFNQGPQYGGDLATMGKESFELYPIDQSKFPVIVIAS